MAPAATVKHSPARFSWLRALLFTLVLVGLVSVAAGEDWKFDIAALAICAMGFGFFFLAFSGGMHFGITFANFLAIYACTFFFFRESNFPEAGHVPAIIALAMPVLVFLGACFMRLRQINAVLHARRRREITALPALWRWVPGVGAVGAATFALPRLYLAATEQELVLLLSMALVSGFIAYAARDVVLLLNDVALIFEGVAHRIDRLMIPMTAFMTLYSLLVVVFACLYRLAEMGAEAPQFLTDSADHFLTFGEAMYFSVITLSTVGYGDIVPVGQLVRLLAAGQVIVGLLLLLFGFSEIARMSDEERASPSSPKLPD